MVRYMRRRRTYRRRAPARRRRSRRYQVRRFRARVQRAVGIEKKYFNLYNTVGLEDGVTMLSQNLTDSITQGLTDAGNRIGDAVRLSSVNVSFTIRPNPTSADTQMARILLVQWKESNAGLTANRPGFDNIFQGGWTDPQSSMEQFYNRDYMRRGRFSIIYDRKFMIKPDTVSEAFITRRLRYRMPSKKISAHLNFDQGGQIAKNHIFLVAFSDTGTQAQQPILTFNVFGTYTDA